MMKRELHVRVSSMVLCHIVASITKCFHMASLSVYVVLLHYSVLH